MLNKKIEVKLGDEKFQLWFNNYAVFELQKLYGIEQSEVLVKVRQRAEDNYLLLISDLIEVGIKGHSMALKQPMPESLEKINELIAVADVNELMSVWTVFVDIMGGNLPNEDKKKVKAEKE